MSIQPVSISHFFAQLSRMKLIYRWPLMRNIQKENISEHSLQVAMVAHALALISNRKFGTTLDADIAHIAVVKTAQTDAAISAVEHWIANDLGITPW